MDVRAPRALGCPEDTVLPAAAGRPFPFSEANKRLEFPPSARLCLVHLGRKMGAGKARAGRQSWRAPVLPPGPAEPMPSVSACACGAPAPDQPRHPLALLHGACVQSQPLSSGCPGIGWCVGFVCVGFGSKGGATAVGGACERTP